MADIFADTQPPMWLQRISQPADTSIASKVVGQLVGGLADASEIAIDKATKKQEQGIDTNWVKELPGSIRSGLTEARLNMNNPMWRIQAQQAQLNLAQQGLQLQNQQSVLDARKQKLAMTDHDQQTMSKWMQDHPTWESRQDATPPDLFTSEAQRMFGQVRMNDAQSVQRKAIVEGIDAFSKSVAALQKIDPIAAAPFATQIGKVPTPELQNKLAEAMDKAQAKQREALKPQTIDVDLGGGKTSKVFYNSKTGHFERIKDTEQEVQDRARVKADEENRKAKLGALRDELRDVNRAIYDSNNQKLTDQNRLKVRRNELQKKLDELTTPSSGNTSGSDTSAKVFTYDAESDALTPK